MENAKLFQEAVSHTQALCTILIQTIEKLRRLDQKMKEDMEESQDMEMVHALERIMASDRAKVLELKQGFEDLQLFCRLPQWLLGPVLTLLPSKRLELKHALNQFSAQVHVEALELRQAVEEMWEQARTQNLSSEDILERKRIVDQMEASMEDPESALGQILEGL